MPLLAGEGEGFLKKGFLVSYGYVGRTFGTDGTPVAEESRDELTVRTALKE